MGLFRRREPTSSEPSGSPEAAGPDPRDAEIAALRTAVDELRRELAVRVDTESADLRAELESTREALTSRVAHESTTLRAELANVRDRVDPALTGVDDLARRVDAIDDRFATPLTDPPPPPPTTPPGADRGELDTLGSQLTRLEERITAVDRRVTAVSTELANQLSELGSDIEELTRVRASADETTDVADASGGGSGTTTDTGTTVDTGMLEELFDELHEAQQRLASEQARYQIAFREDLARLAEDLRRRANR